MLDGPHVVQNVCVARADLNCSLDVFQKEASGRNPAAPPNQIPNVFQRPNQKTPDPREEKSQKEVDVSGVYALQKGCGKQANTEAPNGCESELSRVFSVVQLVLFGDVDCNATPHEAIDARPNEKGEIVEQVSVVTENLEIRAFLSFGFWWAEFGQVPNGSEHVGTKHHGDAEERSWRVKSSVKVVPDERPCQNTKRV